MFKKVLVAEDLDSINHAVATVLKELGVQEVGHAQYCDQAWIMARKALQEKQPYELLICDLSFKPDHREENLISGQELIAALKSEDPSLKVLVNSIEDHPQTVKTLWDSGNIEAYVCKDRNGMKDLKNAIWALEKGNTFNSPRIEAALKKDNLFILNEFEISLLTSISRGLTQEDIRDHLIKNNISPSSKSSIEKRLKELREEFGANTTPHLIGIVKDLKLI
ncbi:DNA-binding response regulator [Salinimicrobium flavum]|uniref:DNA-binding response regulator n=1 Tax=Salinimicrobium flavum TaxID=1737065 RepID=A0ABW5IXY4_9FLAO